MQPVDELVEAWKANTGRYVRAIADIWWDQACPRVVEAVLSGDKARIDDALAELGRVRRSQRLDVLEAIDDILALSEILPIEAAAHLDRLDAVKALTLAWREEPVPAAVPQTIDPLSLHPSFEYLVSRAGEMYEAFENDLSDSPRSVSVVIARLRADLDPLSRLTARIRLGALCHDIFRGWPRAMGDEGFAALTNPVVAVHAADEIAEMSEVNVVCEPLPPSIHGLQGLLTTHGLIG